MAEKTMTVTLREDIGQRLQAFAEERRQTINEVLDALLPAPPSGENWALAFADEMAAADIDWMPGHPQQKSKDQWAIFDIPPLHVPADHPALQVLSREDMYDDDGR